jgi:hypothetical protein
MVRVRFEDSHVRLFGSIVVFLLFVDVSNLEPDILFRQRPRWIGYDVAEALQALLVLLLLLVYYTQSEIDLVGLFKIGLHPHHLRKRLLGVFQRAITVI